MVTPFEGVQVFPNKPKDDPPAVESAEHTGRMFIVLPNYLISLTVHRNMTIKALMTFFVLIKNIFEYAQLFEGASVY